MKRRWLACLMAIVLCFTAFSGCDCNSGSNGDTDNTNKTIEGTIHDFTMKETDEYLVKNGRTDYALVIAEDANSFDRTGRDEFVTLFKQATGINIRVLQESGAGYTHTKDTKYISIGKTKLLESSGLEINYDELGTQGVRILTKDKSIYITGGGTQGALYGVYDFMQITLNFEAYYHDCWVIDEDVENLKLYDYNVTDVPDVEMRCTGWGPVMKNYNNVSYRFRMPYDYVEYLLPVGDAEHGEARQVIHNISELLPKAYGRSEWYQDGGTQLCFTAHGDAEAYEEMVDRLAYVIEQCLKFYPRETYPNYNAATISIEDSSDVCSCASCLAAKEKYGENSGAVIVLCNKVMEKLSAWMSLPENEPYARDDFNLLFLAYWGYNESPTHYDEAQGKYVVNHEDCIMLDNVGVFYCADENFDTYFDVNHELSKKGRDVAGGWFDIASVVYLYTYTSNMHEYLGMNDTYAFFSSSGYQYFVEGGVKYWFNQGSRDSYDLTAFSGLKMFLDYKLEWNASLDSDELTEEWFNAMFKDAAPIMKRLFNAEREHIRAIYEENGLLYEFTMKYWLDQTHFWSIPQLHSWIAICDEANALIEERYKEADYELYEQTKFHIELEWASPAYYLMKCFGAQNGLPKDEVETIIARFDSFFERAKPMAYREVGKGYTLQDFVDSWR